MKKRLNFLRERIEMCFYILSSPKVLVITSPNEGKLVHVDIKSLYISNNDMVSLCSYLLENSKGELQHEQAVDAFIEKLLTA